MAEAVSIVRGGNVRRSLKPKLRPAPENEVIDLTAPATAIELIQMEKLERLQQYAGLGMTPSQIKTAADNFDKVRIDAAMQVMVDKAFNYKVDRVIELVAKGDVAPFKLDNGLYNSVTYLHSTGMSYRDIANELRTRHIAAINYEEALSRQNDLQAKRSEENFSAAATRAMIDGKDDEFINAVIGLEATDKKAGAALRKQYAEAGNDRLTSDSKAIDFLDGKGIQLSYADVFSQLLNLSDADKKKYSDRVKTLESDEFTAAKTIIAGQMKISVRIQDMAADDKNLARHGIFRQIIGELQLRKVMAARNNENFDAIEVGQSLVKQMFTEHLALEFQEDKNSARSILGAVNSDELKGTDNQLDLDDFAAAQTYFESVLTSLKDGDRVGRFKPNDIQLVEMYINAMKKAQGQ